MRPTIHWLNRVANPYLSTVDYQLSRNELVALIHTFRLLSESLRFYSTYLRRAELASAQIPSPPPDPRLGDPLAWTIDTFRAAGCDYATGWVCVAVLVSAAVLLKRCCLQSQKAKHE